MIEKGKLLRPVPGRHPSRSEDVDAFGCPHCGAPLWEVRNGELFLFKCRLGHAFSPDRLTDEQRRVVATSIQVALRASMERSALLQKLTERATQAGHAGVDFLTEQLRKSELNVEELRRVISSLPSERGRFDG